MVKRLTIENLDNPKLDVKFEIGEQLGWKYWKVDWDKMLLISPIHKMVGLTFERTGIAVFVDKFYWYPNQILEADQIPSEENSNGIYALKSYQEIIEYSLPHPPHTGKSPIYVLGAIKMSGVVLEGEKGFRCQYAKVHSLVCLYYATGYDYLSWIQKPEIEKVFENNHPKLNELRAKYCM